MYTPEENENGNSTSEEFNSSPEYEKNDDGTINGEYHFVSDEQTRKPYSDAGYVPSDSAGAVPPRYYCTSPAPTKEKREKHPKKERRGMGAGAVIAVCLVCAILGGLCGGAIVGTVYRPDTQQVEAAAGENTEENTVINKVSPNTTVSTNLVSSGGVISPSTIYSMACTQAVAITTEITYTNFLGYTSSGAVSGSGFIISSNGYILTNYHVIQQAVEGGYDVNVYLYDGTEYVATVVGYEQDNDVAVLKIDVDNLDPVTIGDSDSIDVGESVYAVGNPLGELEYTMTTGTVSALNRDISSTDSSTGTTTTINMFQIDAAVNSGNSGGPVYNSRGEVIGIVTAKYSSSGVEGLGFAIPINDAISIANELITNGYVSGKAYLGVMVETVNSIAVRYYNMVPGAYVYGVESGSCAEAAGIKVGDVIVALDDTQITSMGDLTTAKKAYSAGSSAVVKVYRNGEYVELPIVFDEEVPSNSSSEQSSDNSGFDGGFGSQRP